jgi:hypothetical protein
MVDIANRNSLIQQYIASVKIGAFSKNLGLIARIDAFA